MQEEAKGRASKANLCFSQTENGANEVPIRTRVLARAQTSGGSQVTGESQN
jgi:hypothetical protein